MALVQNRKKYWMLVVGAVVLSFGIGMYAVSASLLSAMSMCNNATNITFVPGTVIQTECSVMRDVGQELTFRAAFFSSGGGNPIAIPAHLVIMNPENEVVFEGDFDDPRIIVPIKPDSGTGTYTAMLTSLEDEANRIHTGQTRVLYGFGFLTSYGDVNNPLGNALLAMVPLAAIASVTGIGMVIYGVVKIVGKKKTAKA